MKKRVIELLTSHGTLVSPETVEYILTKPKPEEYINEVLNNLSELPLFLTMEQLKQLELELATSSRDAKARPDTESAPSTSPSSLMTPEPPQASETLEPKATEDTSSPITSSGEIIKSNLKTSRPMASDIDSNVKVIKDVTGQSTSEGSINDFVKYFRTRFETLRRILQHQRREVMGSINISRLRNQSGPVKFIGMITEVHDTKHGHKILELEDESDSIPVLINNSSPLISMSFVTDEVVCIIGKMGKNDLVYAEDIIRPDVPIIRHPNRAELPINCLFMSDIHVGSNTFLHDAWDRLIRWLNGKYSLNGSDQLRDNIKYIVVAGDIVDGIGVYPDQESELEIPDIYAQYEDLAGKFQEIPEHITLIVQPGNHDAVRPAEPQPTFPTEISQLFSNDIIFVGNPCYCEIESVEVLMYHGRSMDDFVMQLPEATYNKPIQIMKEMLMRRHLAPIYGQRTPIAPEHSDYLLIDKIPDIFVTGHIHKTAFENYRDISLMNASAWQSQTKYQKMMNFNPEPGRVILTDLQSRNVNILDFA
jgi:DNA polymerase II small subunit